MVAPMKPPSIADEYALTEKLESAQEELEKLTVERQSIERRIAKLQGDIVHLAALCGVEVEDPIKQLGLTDAIRYVFGRENRPLSRQQVVEMLEQSYDVSTYKNLAANVHTIVRRLLKSREVIPVPLTGLGRIGDQETYLWTTHGIIPPPPVPNARRFHTSDNLEIKPEDVGRRVRKEFVKPEK